MPFLTQGKTNWKFLLIVIVLAVIVGGGILWWAWNNKPITSKLTDVVVPDDELHYNGFWYISNYGYLQDTSNIVFNGSLDGFEVYVEKYASLPPGKIYVKHGHRDDPRYNEHQVYSINEIPEITIATDKTEYEQGELIEITVRNSSDTSILYYETERFWGIEYLIDKGWKNPEYEKGKELRPVEENMYNSCYDDFPLGYDVVPPVAEIEPNSTLLRQWNQGTCPLEENPREKKFVKHIGTGRYRIIFYYGFEISKKAPYKISNPKIISSNEFMVKEKTKEEPKDWKTYRNEEYGFEIKYLADWKYKNYSAGVRFLSNEHQKAEEEYYRALEEGLTFGGGCYFGISINIKNRIGDEIEDCSDCAIVENVSPEAPELLDKFPGAFEIYHDIYGPDYSIGVPFPDDDKKFASLEVCGLPLVDDSNRYKEIQLYNRMLSTFRFLEVEEEKKPEELKTPALGIKDLIVKWEGQLKCKGEIEWVKIIDIDNDGENEMIASCSLADRLLIFRWEDDNFSLQGDMSKEISINPWRSYALSPNDFGSLYASDRIEFNMVFSPSGGIPQEEENEKTIWVRIETFEWDSIEKELQFKKTKSLFGGSAWYLGDVNNNKRDDLIFFTRTDPSDLLKQDYLVRFFSWDEKKEEFVSIFGEVEISNWMFIAGTPGFAIQPLWYFQDYIFVADTNNNGLNEVVLLDVVGIRDYQYAYLALEWNGDDFIKFRIDEKMKGKYTKYGTIQYKIKSVGDYDGDGKNELITQLLPEEPGEFHIAIFGWNQEKDVYEEILGKILPGYDFIGMGDADNNGTEELIFQDEENNLILLSYGEILEKTSIPGWNIYMNEKFDYLINYPNEVFVQIPSSLADNNDTYFYVSPEDSILTDDRASVRIQIDQNPKHLSLKDWVYSLYNSALERKGWCSQEFKNVLRLSSSCDYRTWEWNHDLISVEEKVVIISTTGSSEKINLFEVSEKMLSTFRFLE